MGLIKNTTPYLGKITLHFEAYPWWTGRTTLNKIHLDLGFTKLVSRVAPKRDADGWVVDPEKMKLIQLHTGGTIGTHTFDEHTLYNSFLGKKGEYIGNSETGWRYYNNCLMVCDAHPVGVAAVIDEKDFGNTNKLPTLIGYYGYTHRGGQTFKIGDRLFDPKYKPKAADYEEWQWAGFQEKYEKAIMAAGALDIKWIEKAGIAYVIPYNLLGKKTITTLKECMQAAININKELG